MPRLPPDALAAAIRRLLRPIVRQLLAWGVTYPVLDQVVRGLYVEVAERDFALPHKRQTDSRVSLVTGIHRKEIARLRRQPDDGRARASLESSVLTRVLGRWMAGPPYADRAGRARALPYESPRARDASFVRLVGAAGFDGPARSVLDEMLRTGAVAWRDDGTVELAREANVPRADLAGKLELLGSDPGELFRTIAHNIEDADTAWLQRKVVYDNIGADALDALRAAARAEGEALIRRANKLLAANDRDRNPDAPGGRRSRVVLGAYYFEEPADGMDAPPEPDPGATPTASPPGRISTSGSSSVKKRSR